MGKHSVLSQRTWPPQAVSLLLLLFLVCGFDLNAVPSASGAGIGEHVPPGTSISPPAGAETDPSLQAVPQKVRDLLALLQEREGIPLPGYIGGRRFQNREGRLPRGRYREYDVNPKVRGRPRDAERIVIEQRTGKAYYTGDHYRTFVPLN